MKTPLIATIAGAAVLGLTVAYAANMDNKTDWYATINCMKVLHLNKPTDLIAQKALYNSVNGPDGITVTDVTALVAKSLKPDYDGMPFTVLLYEKDGKQLPVAYMPNMARCIYVKAVMDGKVKP